MNIEALTKQAVAHYWTTRELQANKQHSKGMSDTGLRSAVTGGAQMDGFISLLTEVILSCGVDSSSIFTKQTLELPGYYRPTKEWDILVVEDGRLLAAVEAKSQVGPSFGNNFNNRVEESIGSAVDIWEAYEKNLFGLSPQPFIGYIFMLEDHVKSRNPVRVKESHFPVLSEFRDASYQKRYELFCRKLVLKRHYTSVCYLLSDRTTGIRGEYREPLAELSMPAFAQALTTHINAFRKQK